MASGLEWSCSWRSAGDIVAALRGEGDYLDWYCSTGEGLVDEQVLAEIGALGWELEEAEPPASDLAGCPLTFDAGEGGSSIRTPAASVARMVAVGCEKRYM